MRKRREWFETFFEGLYGDVLVGQVDEKASLAQARVVKRLTRHSRRMIAVARRPRDSG